MKKALLAIIFLVSLSHLALAHPPSDIEVKFDAQKIEVTVKHLVDNPAQHYIGVIKLLLNGKEVVKQSFILQKDNQSQAAVYYLPGLKKEDKVTLDCSCNIFGSLKKDFTVS